MLLEEFLHRRYVSRCCERADDKKWIDSNPRIGIPRLVSRKEYTGEEKDEDQDHHVSNESEF